MNAFEKLAKQIKEKNSRVVLGLDPEGDNGYISEQELKTLVCETAPYIVGVKPNLAFYEHDNDARKALANVLDYAERWWDLPIILDVKHGDIENTEGRWARADMKNFLPDSVTINAYMGQLNTIHPYLDQNENICVFALASTSNKDTVIQNLYSGGLQIYQHMALEVRKADAARVGLVVGATKSESIKKIRAAELENGYSLDNTAWVLAPGFGRQGGDLSFVKYAGPNAIYPISSGLTNPKYLNGMTPADAAKKWRDDINAAASDGYYMKSISEYFIDDLVASDIMWIAPSADTNTWRILRNKTKSPIYWDVRNIQSYPALRETASYLMTKKIIDTGLCPSQIAAVPYGALCLGMDVARNLGCSVITPRKDGAKDHGDCNDIVGRIHFPNAIIIEDVANGGESIIQTAEQLLRHRITVNQAVVLIDREQGAKQNLADNGIDLISVFTQAEAVSKMDIMHPMRPVVTDYMHKSLR